MTTRPQRRAVACCLFTRLDSGAHARESFNCRLRMLSSRLQDDDDEDDAGDFCQHSNWLAGANS